MARSWAASPTGFHRDARRSARRGGGSRRIPGCKLERAGCNLPSTKGKSRTADGSLESPLRRQALGTASLARGERSLESAHDRLENEDSSLESAHGRLEIAISEPPRADHT